MSVPIRVCLVGAGRAGKVHANSLVVHVPGGHLVGVVDSSAEALQDTGDQFAVDARFTTGAFDETVSAGRFEPQDFLVPRLVGSV